MNSTEPRSISRVPVLVLLAFVTVAIATAGLSQSNSPAIADDGIGISVTVAPSPSSSPSGGGSGPGGSTSSESPSPSPSASTLPVSNDPGLGGIVFVSGLSSRYVASPNPMDSRVSLTFTVRNDAKSTINASARFWATTAVGARIGTERTLDIRKLQPNETRVIQTSISELGQWTAVHTHVTFSPPSVVDGKRLSPVTRDSFVVIPPLVIVGGCAALGLIALLGFRLDWFARVAAAIRGIG